MGSCNSLTEVSVRRRILSHNNHECKTFVNEFDTPLTGLFQFYFVLLKNFVKFNFGV